MSTKLPKQFTMSENQINDHLLQVFQESSNDNLRSRHSSHDMVAWIDKIIQLKPQRVTRSNNKQASSVDGYEAIRFSNEKMFGNTKICPRDIDKQMVKFLYNRIDPHNTMKRLCYSKAPQQQDYYSYSKKQSQNCISKVADQLLQKSKSNPQSPRRIQSAIKGKNYLLQIGSLPNSYNRQKIQSSSQQKLSRSLGQKSNTLTNEKLLENSFSYQSHYGTMYQAMNSQSKTKKDLLVGMQKALSRLSSSNKVEKFIVNPLNSNSQQQPEHLLISHIQPNNFQELDEEFRWWPLENLQRHLLKKYNQSSHFEPSIEINSTQISKLIANPHSGEPTKRTVSIFNPKNQSINLLNKCDIYLQHSQRVKQLLSSKEKQQNNQFSLIKCGEEESQERNFEQELREYENLNSVAVIADLKKTSRHTRAYRMYKTTREKNNHCLTRKIINTLTVDQQRIVVKSAKL